MKMSFANKFHHSAEIFADDVELNVHHCALANKVEVGVIEGVGNDCDAESVGLGVAYSEAYTIDRYRTFLDGNIALACHRWVDVIAETEDMASVGFFHTDANGGGIYVALDNVPVKTPIDAHTSFDVYFVAYFQ